MSLYKPTVSGPVELERLFLSSRFTKSRCRKPARARGDRQREDYLSPRFWPSCPERRFSDILEVVEAFQRLAMTVGAITTYGFDKHMSTALHNAARMKPSLLGRLTHLEAKGILVEARLS